jgi:hypothetical protein
MTPVMEEKLKGRWKGPTPQVLWGKIYQLLFPNEAVPSPGKSACIRVAIKFSQNGSPKSPIAISKAERR